MYFKPNLLAVADFSLPALSSLSTLPPLPDSAGLKWHCSAKPGICCCLIFYFRGQVTMGLNWLYFAVILVRNLLLVARSVFLKLLYLSIFFFVCSSEANAPISDWQVCYDERLLDGEACGPTELYRPGAEVGSRDRVQHCCHGQCLTINNPYVIPCCYNRLCLVKILTVSLDAFKW